MIPLSRELLLSTVRELPALPAVLFELIELCGVFQAHCYRCEDGSAECLLNLIDIAP